MKKLSNVRLGNIIPFLEDFERLAQSDGYSEVIFDDYEFTKNNVLTLMQYLDGLPELLDYLDYASTDLTILKKYFGSLNPNEFKLLVDKLWVENCEAVGLNPQQNSQLSNYQQIQDYKQQVQMQLDFNGDGTDWTALAEAASDVVDEEAENLRNLDYDFSIDGDPKFSTLPTNSGNDFILRKGYSDDTDKIEVYELSYHNLETSDITTILFIEYGVWTKSNELDALLSAEGISIDELLTNLNFWDNDDDVDSIEDGQSFTGSLEEWMELIKTNLPKVNGKVSYHDLNADSYYYDLEDDITVYLSPFFDGDSDNVAIGIVDENGYSIFDGEATIPANLFYDTKGFIKFYTELAKIIFASVSNFDFDDVENQIADLNSTLIGIDNDSEDVVDLTTVDWQNVIQEDWSVEVDGDEIIPGYEFNADSIYYLLDNGRQIYATPFYDGNTQQIISIYDENGDEITHLYLDVPSNINTIESFKSWYLNIISSIFNNWEELVNIVGEDYGDELRESSWDTIVDLLTSGNTSVGDGTDESFTFPNDGGSVDIEWDKSDDTAFIYYQGRSLGKALKLSEGGEEYIVFDDGINQFFFDNNIGHVDKDSFYSYLMRVLVAENYEDEDIEEDVIDRLTYEDSNINNFVNRMNSMYSLIGDNVWLVKTLVADKVLSVDSVVKLDEINEVATLTLSIESNGKSKSLDIYTINDLKYIDDLLMNLRAFRNSNNWIFESAIYFKTTELIETIFGKKSRLSNTADFAYNVWDLGFNRFLFINEDLSSVDIMDRNIEDEYKITNSADIDNIEELLNLFVDAKTNIEDEGIEEDVAYTPFDVTSITYANDVDSNEYDDIWLVTFNDGNTFHYNHGTESFTDTDSIDPVTLNSVINRVLGMDISKEMYLDDQDTYLSLYSILPEHIEIFENNGFSRNMIEDMLPELIVNNDLSVSDWFNKDILSLKIQSYEAIDPEDIDEEPNHFRIQGISANYAWNFINTYVDTEATIMFSGANADEPHKLTDEDSFTEYWKMLQDNADELGNNFAGDLFWWYQYAGDWMIKCTTISIDEDYTLDTDGEGLISVESLDPFVYDVDETNETIERLGINLTEDWHTSWAEISSEFLKDVGDFGDEIEGSIYEQLVGILGLTPNSNGFIVSFEKYSFDDLKRMSIGGLTVYDDFPDYVGDVYFNTSGEPNTFKMVSLFYNKSTENYFIDLDINEIGEVKIDNNIMNVVVESEDLNRMEIYDEDPFDDDVVNYGSILEYFVNDGTGLNNLLGIWMGNYDTAIEYPIGDVAFRFDEEMLTNFRNLDVNEIDDTDPNGAIFIKVDKGFIMPKNPVDLYRYMRAIGFKTNNGGYVLGNIFMAYLNSGIGDQSSISLGIEELVAQMTNDISEMNDDILAEEGGEGQPIVNFSMEEGDSILTDIGTAMLWIISYVPFETICKMIGITNFHEYMDQRGYSEVSSTGDGNETILVLDKYHTNNSLYNIDKLNSPGLISTMLEIIEDSDDNNILLDEDNEVGRTVIDLVEGETTQGIGVVVYIDNDVVTTELTWHNFIDGGIYTIGWVSDNQVMWFNNDGTSTLSLLNELEIDEDLLISRINDAIKRIINEVNRGR